MTGRADTPEKKAEVIRRILAAWEKSPEQRLGQFLANVIQDHGKETFQGKGSWPSLFYVEDEPLAELCERMVAR